MKVLQHIQDSVLGRVRAPRPLMHYTESVSEELRLHAETHLRHRLEIKLAVDMTAPSDDTQELRRRAARMFLHELYGEVADEIHAVLRDLYQEQQYRAPDDPVLTRLSKLVKDLEGWNV